MVDEPEKISQFPEEVEGVVKTSTVRFSFIASSTELALGEHLNFEIQCFQKDL